MHGVMLRALGALVQIAVPAAVVWAMWRSLHAMVQSACDTAWPISLTAVLCGRAPPFLYGSLALAVFAGLVIALLIAPVVLMGHRR